MRSIAITSGKGGVGKTTIATNLGLLLSQSGKKTVVVDADVAMANISIMLGISRAPINLHNVLMGEANIKDAMYEGPSKLKYVPSGLSAEKVKRLDLKHLESSIEELTGSADYVLLDTAPGLDSIVEAAIKSSKEILLVTTSEPAALADALKVKNYADKTGKKVIGVITNRVLKDPAEVKKEDIETLLGAKVIAEIPDDIEVRRATASQQLVITTKPHSPASTAIKKIAMFLEGGKIKEEKKVKKGFFTSIINAILGKKS
ncbi:MAG: cell division ATPase MinD [Candidatus Micrarchaeia archaeon]